MFHDRTHQYDPYKTGSIFSVSIVTHDDEITLNVAFLKEHQVFSSDTLLRQVAKHVEVLLFWLNNPHYRPMRS